MNIDGIEIVINRIYKDSTAVNKMIQVCADNDDDGWTYTATETDTGTGRYFILVRDETGYPIGTL